MKTSSGDSVISRIGIGTDSAMHIGAMAASAFTLYLLVTLLVTSVVASVMFFSNTTTDQRAVTYAYAEAKFKVGFASMGRANVDVTIQGKELTFPARKILTHDKFYSATMRSVDELKKGAIYGSLIGLVISLIGGFVSYRHGKEMREDESLRGGRIVEDTDLSEALIKAGKASSDLFIGNIPLVHDSETKHLLLTGAPGTGKTVIMKQLMDAIRARGDVAVVYDNTGDFVRTYFREGKDHILTPLDTRSEFWSPFDEIQNPLDAMTLSGSFVPEQKGENAFFNQAAQTLLSELMLALKTKGYTSVVDLQHATTSMSYEGLQELLKGTKAARFFAEGNERTAESIISTLNTYTASLDILQTPKDGDETFSVTNWIEGIDGGTNDGEWLFLCSRARQHKTVMPLISAWINAAANALLSTSVNRDRRVWFIVDEMPSLNKMPALVSLLAEGRKYGACGVIGIQDVSQLRERYGKDDAETFISLCNTHAILRVNSAETAEYASKMLGKVEVREQSMSRQMSAMDARDGVSVSDRVVQRELVMPTEIMRIADLNAYVKLAGDHPISKTVMNWKDREDIAEPLIERDLETLWDRYTDNTPKIESTETESDDTQTPGRASAMIEDFEDPEFLTECDVADEQISSSDEPKRRIKSIKDDL